MSIIDIQNLTFHYRALGPPRPAALKKINLRIEPGEFVIVAGLSGSGKTTLMQHFTGLLKPDSGRVLIDGKRLHSNEVRLSEVRRRIGLVFQFPETQLFGETVFSDLAFGPQNLGFEESEIMERVNKASDLLGLDLDKLGSRPPSALSTGERRLVAIASVVAMQPECLVLDEPTSGLDSHAVQKVIDFLTSYRAGSKTVILITHHTELMFLASRIVVLDHGEIAFDGLPKKMFEAYSNSEKPILPFPRVHLLADFLCEKGLCEKADFWTSDALLSELRRVCLAVSK